MLSSNHDFDFRYNYTPEKGDLRSHEFHPVMNTMVETEILCSWLVVTYSDWPRPASINVKKDDDENARNNWVNIRCRSASDLIGTGDNELDQDYWYRGLLLQVDPNSGL